MTKAEQVCRQFKALFRNKPGWFGPFGQNLASRSETNFPAHGKMPTEGRQRADDAGGKEKQRGNGGKDAGFGHFGGLKTDSREECAC
ncbi:MAG: hypothetical protein GXY32_04895 [Ruminococcaceae bacterium]|nr:hypothetical protein [Oscillospiraceae bacterium]